MPNIIYPLKGPMHGKYIIASFLRGLALADHPACIVSVHGSEYRHASYIHDVDIDPAVLDRDYITHDDEVRTIVSRLQSGYSDAYRKATSSSDSCAIRIGDVLFHIHSLTTAETQDSVVNHRVAVVTGAAQGFGKGIAEALVARGARVYIADLNISHADRTAHALCEKYGRECAKAVLCNCADEDSVRTAAQEIFQDCGGIDLLINNAGIVKSGAVEKLSVEDFMQVTQVNYTGYFLMVKYLFPAMKYQFLANNMLSSDIILINSVSGLIGSRKNSAYSGSKFGGIGLTKSFALEFAEFKVKVNAVCPGHFLDGPLWSDPETGLFVQYLKEGKVPHAKSVEDVRNAYEEKSLLKRGCTVDDVVRGVLYIIEQKFETGQALPVAGGQIMLS